MRSSPQPNARRPLHNASRYGLSGLATLSLLFGCAATAQKDESPEGVRLHAELLRFAQYYSAAISATADEIAEATDDRLVREMTLRWKLETIPLMHRVVAHDDPRHGLVDAWLMCVRQRINLEEGYLETALGDEQPLAIATVKDLQDRVATIARGFLPAEVFDEAEAELEAFVRGEPFEGNFTSQLSQASSRIAEESHPSLFQLLSIPIGGLSETAKAVSRVAVVGEMFTGVVHEMPERIRWETQLFLLEASRTGALADAIGDFDRLSTSIESLAESARSLPTDVRAEVEEVLSSSGTTLEQARELVTETRAMLAELDGPLESARAATAEMSRAGEAWTTAGTAVDAAMTTIGHLGDAGPAAASAPAGTGDSFKISDLTEAGNSLHGAATAIQSLLGDLESDETDATVKASLDVATARLEELVDTITLRAILVVGILLVGAFVIRRYGSRREQVA